MISIVIPCYNEEENIPLLGKRVHEMIADTEENLEILLVDNGSTDSSAEVLHALVEEDATASIQLVSVAQNEGYGNGIMAGVKEARGEIISWTHADLQTDLMDVLKAVEGFRDEISSGSAVVKGRREGRGLLDTFFTFGMSVFSSLALKTSFSDVNAQPKVFARSFLNHLEDAPKDFSLDLYFLYQAKRQGLEICEVPVVFADRYAGEAKGGGTLKGKYKLVKRTIRYIFELRKRLDGA